MKKETEDEQIAFITERPISLFLEKVTYRKQNIFLQVFISIDLLNEF